MKFKSTNNFLDLVRTGNVSQIDLEGFIYKKTKKHNIDKLKTLFKDIEFYLFVEKDFLICEITPEDWVQKHKYYKDKGEQTPQKKEKNIIKILNEKRGLDVTNEPEFYYYYCEESLFFPFEFFCIYELQRYIEKLIKNAENINSKHENIFSNNGFILFEHILKEYVKNKRGRLSDIHFFYWVMFNNKPQLIHQRPERFKGWFFDTFKEDLGKIKTYNQVENADRLKHYSNALEWFKSHNR